MDERTLGAILVGVVYPTMIVAVFGLFVLLLVKAEKYRTSSSKRVEHRIRK